MKTPNRAALFVAPLSAVFLALGGLLLLPAFGPSSGAIAASAVTPAVGQPCITAKGDDPKACAELVELEVQDVVPLVEAQTHAVVLTTKDRAIVLPVFVDEASAVSIAFRLADRDPPQPLAQDLLDDVVKQLGGKVTEVRIDDLRDNVYSGRVFLEQGKRKMTLDARPSDSIAMALTSHARIRVTRKVLTIAGISRDEIEGLQKDGPGVGGSGKGGMLEEDGTPLPLPGMPGAPDTGEPPIQMDTEGLPPGHPLPAPPKGTGKEIEL
ncbi:bifunctional nuclease family protein [Pyxidicoccus xibeiensis]|uniref:bifunctional nuclease family protein n=1 Tax=Pyxidicoccus xibeiensis TaxID=2906759 RepID=UPI0020A7DCA1|nr:bifunctional nuclease domain-containing protein [Pyxidicoccus xibeiensis]MCP3141968.1 bifunctional nuclease family protein [Pyxidicoccus xibeiensis]